MNKFFQRLFLFEKYNFKTGLSKQQIFDKVKSIDGSLYMGYYRRVTKSGFVIRNRFIKRRGFIKTRNSFTPVAKGTVVENDGVTTISITTRMHLIPLILFVPIYVLSLLTIVLIPLVFLILHLSFFKPSKRLVEYIETLLLCEEA